MTRKAKLRVYVDRKHEWRWNLKSPYNGKCIADSGEGYKTRAACLKGWASVVRYAGTAEEG